MVLEKEVVSVEEEWGISVKERFMVEEKGENLFLILVVNRIKRKDFIENFNIYIGGWNISNIYYWIVSFFFYFLWF